MLKAFRILSVLILIALTLATSIACKAEYNLYVSVGSGQGTVSPASGKYTEGTSVTLSATPASGWEFSHWGGDCEGSNSPIIIDMDSGKIIKAYFIEAQPTPIPSPTPTPTSGLTPTPTVTPSSTLTDTPIESPTSTPAPSSLIIFGSDRTGNYEIYSMQADGTNQTQLTDNSEVENCMPSLSPDRSRIAFISSPLYDFSQIYIMNTDGTGKTKITDVTSSEEHPGSSPPVWSPQGDKIAYTGGTGILYTLYIDGTNVTQVATGVHSYFSWSPDGEKIAYRSLNDWELYIVNIDGSSNTKITNINPSGTGSESFPCWSPDGNQIAFACEQQIWTVSEDGSTQTQITSSTGWYGAPSYSPDGTKIAAYTSDGEGGICVMSPDGSNYMVVTNTAVWSSQPSWSPDSNKIAFVSAIDDYTNPEIFIVNADGTNALRLTNSPSEDRSPQWGTPAFWFW